MSKKILFFAVNSRYSHSCLALYYLRTVIKDLNYSSQLLEYSINDRIDDLLFHIYQIRPHVLVLSLYIWNKSFVLQMCKDLKKILPDMLIVGGGPEVSYLDDLTDHYHDFDFIIRGPGEKAFFELARHNFDKDKFTDDLIDTHQLPCVIDIQNYPFTEIPFPYEKNDISNFQHKYLYYESSRSCPFQCSYCLSSRNDQKLEYKDIALVKNELLTLLSYNIKIVKFIDRSFNVNMDYAKEIWRFLIQEQRQTKFHFEIHPDYIDEEMLDIFKSAPQDLFQFEIGVQSVNPNTLKAVMRYSDWDLVKEKLKKLLSINNIHYHLDQIAGLPFEDYTSLKYSFNEIFSLKPDHYQMGILKVLTGTKMHEQQKEFGLTYSDREPYQIFSTSWISYEELIEYQSVDHVIDILYNSKHFLNFFNVVFEVFTDFYSLFLNLAQCFEQNQISKKEKNYKHIVSVFYQFISDLKVNTDRLVLLQDAIMFDWALLSNSHFYPESINSTKSDQFKENCWLKIKEKRKGDSGLIGHSWFDLSELRKAKFFTAQDIKFYQHIDWKNYQVIQNNEDLSEEFIEGIVVISKERLIVWKENLKQL